MNAFIRRSLMIAALLGLSCAGIAMAHASNVSLCRNPAECSVKAL